MRPVSSSFSSAALFVCTLALLGCKRTQKSQSPEKQAEEPAATASSPHDASKAAPGVAGCELEPVNDDVIRVHNRALGYSFLAILPPLRVECGDPERLIVRNHDGLVEWNITAIGEREALDQQAFLEALWRKNEAASGPQRLAFGGGLEVTPKGHVVLSYLARVPGIAGGEPLTSVIFVNLRQHANGEAFLMRMIAEVEAGSDPEIARARMRGPFMPMFDEFLLATTDAS